MLVQQRQPIIQIDEYKQFLRSPWLQKNYWNDLIGVDWHNQLIKCVEMGDNTEERMIIDQEQLTNIESENIKSLLLVFFVNGYHITYIEKQNFRYHFYNKFHSTIIQFQKTYPQQLYSIIDPQLPISKSIFLESIIMLLYQATQLFIQSNQTTLEKYEDNIELIGECKLSFKLTYIQLMEQMKEVLFKCQVEGQTLITICINQLLNSESLYQNLIKEQEQQIRINDTKFMTQLMKLFIFTSEMPLHVSRQIIRQIFTLNEQQQNFQLSKQIFKNLHSSNDIILCLDTIQIWLKSKHYPVYQQIRLFLDELLKHNNKELNYDNESIKLLFDLLNEIQKSGFIDGINQQDDLVEELILIFHTLWQSFDDETKENYYEKKTELWLNYIHKLNLLLNPLTPVKNQQSDTKGCFGLYLILYDIQNTKKYISSANILVYFIDSLFPLEQTTIKESYLMQNFVKSTIEFIVDSNLKEQDQIFQIIEKVLKSVCYLNPNFKQKIFQLIWARWQPEDPFYLQILQQIVSIFLENEDQQLGTRNSFFISILAMESSKKIVHPQKFHTLLQICQYLCLENAPVNMESIFSQHDTYANCLYLKQYKIKKSFQEFFQVNNYYSMIITLISGIQNTTNLVYILKEFIKLEWLLTEGLKLVQVEFADEFVSFLEQKLYLFSDEQTKELMELLIDCSVSMISRFIRLKNVPNPAEQYQEIVIQNEFCLKVLVEVFIFNSPPSDQLRINCLTLIGIMISCNEYNQMIFREAVRLSNFLQCMRNQKNKELQKLMEEVLKRSLSFIRNDQIQRLIQNAPKETSKSKVFRQSAFSQYVGATLENLQNSKDIKGKRFFQLLGKESGVILKNYCDFSKKNWRCFTIMIEFKREGLYFINSNAKGIEETFKKEQVLFNLSGNIEKVDKLSVNQVPSQKQNLQQIDLIQVSLINQWMTETNYLQTKLNPLESHIKLSILNHEQQVKEFSIFYTQQTKDEQILLMVMVDDKGKGQITVNIQNQNIKPFVIKTFIPEYVKKYSDKHQVSVSLGSYYNNQSFQKSFQGVICNFALIENILVQKQVNAIFQRTSNNLIEVIEKETMNFSTEDAIESREMQYLDLEKFKTSYQLVEIKDAIRVTKAQNVQEQSFLMHMLKKQVQHKITNEINTDVKIFYQGANIIEDVGLAEVFLSLENIEIILFIIQITTQTFFELDNQDRRQSRLRSAKLVLQNNSPLKLKSKGVFKRTNYFDAYDRQLFFTKDLKKNREDYLNSQQYQQKLKKQNSSTISQTESPGQQRKNFLMLDSDSNQNSIVVQQFPAVTQFQPDEIQNSLFNIPINQITTAFSQEQGLQIQKSNDSDAKQTSPTELPHVEVPKFISTNEKFVLERIIVDRKISAPFQRKATKHFTQNLSPKKIQAFQQFQHLNEPQSDKLIPEVQERESTQNDPYNYQCEWIRVKIQIFGELKINEKDKFIQFISEGKERPDKEFYVYGTIPDNLKKVRKTKIININQIQEIQTRRYSHKEIAIEIFCKNTKSYFFVLYDQEKRAQFLNQMKQCNVINVVIDRRAEFQAKKYTKKWLNGKLSNFQYLMLVNKYAGRSFNDLNQYPIFPWVLNDYRSKSIDLNNKEVYRDLEKMIGVLNSTRLENCKIRAETLRQTQNECFLFGSHYSVAAQIINTLVRLEPFTTLQCELQDGKLDQPDRIFFSIPNTWDSCQNDNQDFRELIPEYFYLPEFLKNINQISFGQRQNNESVDDCVLPPWASNSETFIEINRKALESCYVSEKLHHWINLIFGPYNSGEEARKRDNLYHPLTYETCWQSLEKLPLEEKKGYLSQIQQFGQVPFQLFTKTHQQKQKIEQNLYSPLNLIKILSEKKIASAKRLAKLDKKIAIRIYKENDNLYALLNNKSVQKFKIHTQQDRRDSEDKQNNAYTFSITEVENKLHIESCCILKEMISPQRILKNTQPCHPKGVQFQFDDSMLFVAGYMSGAVYIYNLHYDKQQPQSLISYKIKLHKKRVTCLSYSSKLKLLCLGAKDNRVTVWRFNSQTDKSTQLFQTPKFILYGHDKTITAVLLDDILQIVISLDKTGKLQIHSIITGVLLNEIKIDLAISEKIWNVVSNGDGIIVLLTNHSELIAMNINGLVIQRYCYNNIGNITQISFYQKQNLLVSTLKGEILLIKDISFLTEQHPIIFHVYQNTQNIGVVTFSQFIENDSLVIIISLMDGTIYRYQIYAEPNPEFANYLNRFGM